MLGTLTSQPTVPLHELPPARLVIHRQISAHERCKWTRESSVEVGHLSVFLPPASLAVDNGRAPHTAARHEEADAREGSRCTPSFGLGTTPLSSTRLHQ